MDSVKTTVQDNILSSLQIIKNGDNLADKANLSMVIGLFAAKKDNSGRRVVIYEQSTCQSTG